MKRVQQMIISTVQRAMRRRVPTVPLMVPHGTAGAGSDFESALELLQGSEEPRQLWRRKRVKLPFGRTL